jgi:hypothetical protein
MKHIYEDRDYDKTVNELIDWGILERNAVNELLPTADFLIMLFEYKGHGLVSYDDDEGITDEQWLDDLKTELENLIAVWTMQVINGRSYGNLKCDQHVNIVSAIIKDIHDRRSAAIHRRTRSYNNKS